MQLTMKLIFVHGLLEFTKNDKTDPKQFFKDDFFFENQTYLIFEIEKVKCFEIDNALKLRML
jgi:hypothetical protein